MVLLSYSGGNIVKKSMEPQNIDFSSKIFAFFPEKNVYLLKKEVFYENT